MKSLKSIYSVSPEDIRLRVPIFNGILIVLFFLSLGIIASDIATEASLIETIQHAVMSILTAIAWYMVRRGQFRIVSDVYFVLIELAMLYLRLDEGYTGPNTFPLFAAILGSFLVFGAVFIDSRTVLFSLCGVFVVSFFGFAAYIGFRAEGNTERTFFLEIVYPAIAVLAVSFGLVSTRLIFDRVMRTAITTLDNVREINDHTRNVASESAVQLSKAALLQADTMETAHAAVEIEENMLHIGSRITELDRRIEHAENAISDVKVSAEALSELSRTQAVQVNESGASIEEMVASIRNVSRIIEERTSSVNALTAKASEGERTVNDTVESFRNVTSYMNAIRDTAVVIGDIADRTNILAMNAAIQAAHAGDSGKGFAVVAGEIRSLAESSSSSAKDIAVTLADLAGSIQQTGGTINSAGSAFRDIVVDINVFAAAIREIAGNARELEAGSREILNATANLNNITQQVDEQAAHVRDSQVSFAEDVAVVGDISREITRGTSEIAAGITLIKSAIDGISNLAGDLQNQSRSLNISLQTGSGKK